MLQKKNFLISKHVFHSKNNDIVIREMNVFQYKLKFLEQFSKCKVQNDINAWFFFIFCNKTEYVSWKYKLCKTFCILIKAALRFLTIINLVLLILRIPPWNDNHSELWLSDCSFVHNIKFMEKSQTPNNALLLARTIFWNQSGNSFSKDSDMKVVFWNRIEWSNGLNLLLKNVRIIRVQL